MEVFFMISAQTVKELRDRTGAGMMDCKKALNETNGDIEKAIEVLRERGLAAAAKKSGRIASEGLVSTSLSEDKKSGSIIEVNCETDFVSLNEEFSGFVKAAAKNALTTKAVTIDEFVEEKNPYKDEAIKDTVTGLIAKLGENMAVRRFKKLEVKNGVVESYIHGGGTIGVLVALECDKASDILPTVAKDIAMQVAAANPLFLDKNEVDNDTLNKEREIYKVQAMNEGKPEKIAEKMVEGRIQKYYKENCLIEQVWIRNSDYTISKYLLEKSKEIGSEIKLTGFVRFEKGEGIEKKEENFAEEVKKQMEQSK
jgi:elongation factor Ts